MPDVAFKGAIIIGASSGIGEELTKALAASGCKVAALARRKDRLLRLAEAFPGMVLPYVHDVLDTSTAPTLFRQIVLDLGGVDLIVYGAGVMPAIRINEYSFEKDKLILETNLIGAVAWLNEAAIFFENSRNGTIIAIGSVAGDRGRAGQPAYNASKAALACYMESLRNRLSRFGVSVVTVKPGPVITDMTEGLNLRGAMEAKAVAHLILSKASRSGEHYLAASHRIAFTIIRHIPGFVFRRLKL